MENSPVSKQGQQEPLRFLVFSASLRIDSLNTQLARLAVQIIEKNGGIVDYATMDEFDGPSFNQDLEVNDFHPAGAIEFRKRLLANDALVVSSPEYNGSMPGLLKNAIDWVSRFRPQPLKDRNALLMSASPSMIGGARGLLSLRVPFEHLGTRVYPNMFSLAMAHQAFTPQGQIADATLSQRFEDNIVAFMSLAEATKNYPCIKKAWVEFLGEKTDPVIERVE